LQKESDPPEEAGRFAFVFEIQAAKQTLTNLNQKHYFVVTLPWSSQ
jgi:hypothetical protein